VTWLLEHNHCVARIAASHHVVSQWAAGYGDWRVAWGTGADSDGPIDAGGGWEV